LKYDGFRTLVHVRRDGAYVVSRNGNRFGQLTALGAELLRVAPCALGRT
jgi:ATP-dependent DNA ligase